ncbi:hypothetical protein OG342_31610 [Streptomyces bobili]|uniref:hypothetical protein n=1 Tax=Streptomyces bobili TaxID=67280 RepID=UPI00225B69FD|nr:hypothetical protein [Streptomyces bobili]MCX5527357.1 hypothetical protein [Streptomyces bobili]
MPPRRARALTARHTSPPAGPLTPLPANGVEAVADVAERGTANGTAAQRRTAPAGTRRRRSAPTT